MSDDLDFDMEVVEEDELDELGGGGTSSSEESTHSATEESGDETTEEAGLEMNVVKTDELSSRDPANEVGESGQGARDEKEDRSTARISKEDIPEDWEAVQLGDNTYFQRFSGDTPTVGNSEYWGGDILWLSNSEVEDGEVNIVDQTERTLTPAGLDECTAEVIPSHSVILSCTASIGKVAINTVEMATNQQFNSFKPTEEVNAYYLANQFLRKKPELETIGGATTHNHLPVYMLEKVGIPMPPLPEQRKIASVLYTVDQAIQKTEAIIEKLRRLRRNYIDEVCKSGYYEHDEKRSVRVGPRKVEIPTSWDFVDLESVTSLITKGQTPTSHGFEYLDSGINFVKAESIDEDGRLIEGKFAHIGKEADQKLSRSRLESGDVLFSIAGALGKVAQVREHHLPANINQALALIRCDDERIENRFVRYYLESETIRKYIQSISTVTAQPNLSLKQVSEFNVLLPPLEEQKAIAQACNHFGKGIRNEEKQLRQLQRLKKGLMQDLLTGEVRTAEKSIDVLDEVKVHG